MINKSKLSDFKMDNQFCECVKIRKSCHFYQFRYKHREKIGILIE